MTTEKPKSLADALRLFQLKVKAAPKSGFTKFPNPREYSKLEDVLQIVNMHMNLASLILKLVNTLLLSKETLSTYW